MFLVIEGDDRTGKDTLISNIAKATNWGINIISRGPAGYEAYDKMYNRLTEKRHNNYLECVETLEHGEYIVLYCHGDAKTLYERRQLETDDGTHPESPKGKELSIEDIQKRQDIYNETLLEFYPENKITRLDSTTLTIEEMAEKALKTLSSVLDI